MRTARGGPEPSSVHPWRRAAYSSSSGCSSGGVSPSRPLRSSSSVIRSKTTSVSSASTLPPAPPISGTVSGSGSSTSTYFCSEWMRSSLRSPGETVSSAISRSATTGFLSRSRSIVSGAPDEIRRARWLASSTSSNRFSTLSMQSSTVTRAMRGSSHGVSTVAESAPCIRKPAPKQPFRAITAGDGWPLPHHATELEPARGNPSTGRGTFHGRALTCLTGFATCAASTGRHDMARAFVFPGQGSQAVGMGKALADAFPQARAVLDEVDAALSQKLSGLMFEGPAEELTLTANAQPALMAVSLAAIRVLEAEARLDLARDAAFVAGHSLGEYSALAAAGTFSIADAARLLRVRGEAMQNATPVGVGAMAALLGLDAEAAAEVARDAAQGEVCDVANDNGGAQVVVSGLMAPAAAAMREALARVAMRAPAVPVVANVEAAPLTDPARIRDALVRQVTATVRWRECVAAMAGQGVDRFYEIGAGKVLTGLVRRIAPGATGAAVGTPEDVAAFKAALA